MLTLIFARVLLYYRKMVEARVTTSRRPFWHEVRSRGHRETSKHY